MGSDTNGSTTVEYYPNPIDMSLVLSNLRTVNEILTSSCNSDKIVGLSFQQVNSLMKAKELIQKVIRSHDDSIYNSLDSYESRTYKSKRW